MADPILQRAEEAQRLAADPTASVWVGASAGTGKTKVLTDRVLNLLLTGLKPERILCLTFTKAAAAEMANRIAKELSNWSTQTDQNLAQTLTKLTGTAPSAQQMIQARRLFTKVLDTPGGMHIQTIHSFCQSLLGRFPLEAGIAPHFSVMDDRDALEALAGAEETVLMRARAGEDERLAKALAVVTGHIHESAFGDLMASLAYQRGKLQRLFDRAGSVEAIMAELRDYLEIAQAETLETALAKACEEEAFDGDTLRRITDLFSSGNATEQKVSTGLAKWLAGSSEERIDGLDDYARVFLANFGKADEKIKAQRSLISKANLEKFPWALDALFTEAERMFALSQRKRSLITLEATEALLVLAETLIGIYRQIKENRAQLDYDDLILKTRDLLRAPGVAPWVLFKLDGGLEHILVDEAQDTNPDQWQVIEALADEFFAGLGATEAARTVFAVGDVKQSIYSFQGADPQAFEYMRDLFAERIPESGQIWRPISLTVSFRSTKAVLAAVDAIFSRDKPAASGVALDGLDVRHDAWRLGPGRVEVWPAVVPRGKPEREPWKPPVEPLTADSSRQRLASLVAKRIERMIGSESLESQNRPIAPGDIMVLVRRRGAFVEELVRELKRLKVPVAGVDRMVLSEQLAVMDLIALGRFLLLPEDDLTLATVLKSPLVGLTEKQLFDLAFERPGTLFDALAHKARMTPAFSQAYEYLTDLLSLADQMPPFELFSHVLSAKSGQQKIFARLGPEAEDPLSEFIDLAMAFEQKHVPSLEGFLHWLASAEVEIKRDLEHGGQTVRVMTVHGAKGLQAPIVFLPDTLQVPTQSDALLWPVWNEGEPTLLWPPRAAYRDETAGEITDRNKAAALKEYRRLLYVALTRAEDRLIICGWQMSQEPSEDCWHNNIKNGLSDHAEVQDDPFLGEMGETESTEILVLTNEGSVESKADDEQSQEIGLENALPLWARSDPPPEDRPVRPLSPSKPDEEPPARSPLGTDDGARFKRGRLIHRLLETLPSLAPELRKAAARNWLARPAHDLSPETQAELLNETLAVLKDARFAEIFHPEALAEAPLAGEIDGTVIAAQVDRLVVTEREVLVIDYKTNRPPPEKVEAVPKVYFKQMAAYRALLSRLYPDKTIRCALLWTDGPRLMELPENVLDTVIP